ncbi:MAG: hypothetical protein L0I56_04050 [Lacticaseibacillus paracasei]|nr:hypothetical protein [Lacticaseibacillus paracasei]MDN6418130.1 hypothetical protein [Lactiplantibacillus plantarum]MDN6005855.1 hypothetical protein [Lacticaseibacillus paracasei]MDN6090929.1 hypothetical protein [Lacticaseibacillus paracasei]MDN6102979.1 hypothetical protein [Lacticaseibacillus paracasei]
MILVIAGSTVILRRRKRS